MADDPNQEFVVDHGEYVDVCVGTATWKTRDGKFILEEDFTHTSEI
jgi:hypothetical protein